MVKVLIELTKGNWGEFNFNYLTVKTTQDIMQRLPKEQRTPAVFLHHIIYEPHLTLQEWRTKIPLVFLNTIFLCITEALTEHRKNQEKLDNILLEIQKYSMKAIFTENEEEMEKDLSKLIRKRDKIHEKVKNIEDDDGTITFSLEDISKIKKNRNLYI